MRLDIQFRRKNYACQLSYLNLLFFYVINYKLNHVISSILSLISLNIDVLPLINKKCSEQNFHKT